LPSWKSKNFFRIFFATDVHASERTFSKFLNAASFYKADALVLGGDITGKLVIPIFEENENGRARFETELLGQKLSLESKEALDKIIARVGLLGFYHYVTTKPEWEEIDSDVEKYQALYQKLALERLNTWISEAEQKLAKENVRMYVTGGNDDPPRIIDAFQNHEWITNSEGRVTMLGEAFPMISMGYSNHTPWKTPRECDEEELSKKIHEQARQLSDFKRAIFNFHVPPLNSGIDLAPMVDGSVDPPKYVTKNGMPVMTNVGSKAVREAIEIHSPMLGLHGHIHESRGSIKIGKTLCMNPGSEYSEGILKGVMVNLDENGVKSHQFTSG
jgi:Icc-related predicted phosphoesterase